jgi:hypothetical protein
VKRIVDGKKVFVKSHACRKGVCHSGEQASGTVGISMGALGRGKGKSCENWFQSGFYGSELVRLWGART